MGEEIEVIEGKLTSESFSYDGKHYVVKDAVCNQFPVSKMPNRWERPIIPIWSHILFYMRMYSTLCPVPQRGSSRNWWFSKQSVKSRVHPWKAWDCRWRHRL
jgi:hypothetical protein